MKRASIIVEFRHTRCGCCKVALRDELATVCPVCGAVFDSINSNHVGLAAKLEQRREVAGVRECHARRVDQDADAIELMSS